MVYDIFMMTEHDPLFERYTNECENGETVVLWRCHCKCNPDEPIGGWQPSLAAADSVWESHAFRVAQQERFSFPTA